VTAEAEAETVVEVLVLDLLVVERAAVVALEATLAELGKMVVTLEASATAEWAAVEAVMGVTMVVA
jgi:hypothetical protein